ncbi:hypothetical protein J4456_03895 [Candidatus Pacearchaeota archaeon]|nr:hypothetical protein [Candidatus Pacearchaeota archaeon]
MELYTPKIIPKTWGYEEVIAHEDVNGVEMYCGKKLHLNKGFRCSLHSHSKDETFYIESGRILFEMEDDDAWIEGRIMILTDIVRILPFRKHRFSGIDSSIIIEFSTTDCESERFSLSEAIPDFENWRRDILDKYGR